MSLNTPQVPFVSGTVVPAAQLNALVTALNGLQAAWDPWTPVRTGFSVGNGTEVARFLRVGKTVFYRYRLTLGSTSTVTGNFDVGLPVAPAADYVVNDVLGEAHLYDASVGAGSRTAGTAVYDGAAGVILLADRLASATVNATNPWTWAVGDIVSVTGKYETA